MSENQRMVEDLSVLSPLKNDKSVRESFQVFSQNFKFLKIPISTNILEY